MAKIIQKKSVYCETMFKRITWKEIIQIYCQSVLIMFYIGFVNLLKITKMYFDKMVKQKIMKQFKMLSALRGVKDNYLERRKSVSRKKYNTDGHSISPLTLTSRLGAHKYIKIEVDIIF